MSVLLKKLSFRSGLFLALGALVLAVPFLLSKINAAQATAPDLNYTVQYWNDPDWMTCTAPEMSTSTPDLVQEEATVVHHWSGGSPGTSVNGECFTARWTKTVDLAAGTYIFKVGADDGVRLYVDGHEVINEWIIEGETQYTARVDLAAGIHTIRLDYFQGFGGSDLEFSFAQPLADTNTWGTDNSVYAMSMGPDNKLYVGGDFDYIGPNTGAWVPVNTTSAHPLLGFPQVTGGSVYAAAPDNAGGWYIGGDFYYVNGATRQRLAHILADGSLDPSWNPGADGTVLALVHSSSTLYIGGSFGSVGGASRDYVAAVDESGTVTDWDPEANNQVRTLALSNDGTVIYVGGYFTGISGVTRDRIAALDTNGSAMSWDPDANNAVIEITVSGSTVYAGGTFTSIGGATRHYIAALDAAGAATAWDPSANSTVRTILVQGDTVYAGGDFSFIGGTARNSIAALGITSGTTTDWDPNANGSVYDLSAADGKIYVAGTYTAIGGATRRHIAALDASTGNATTWDPTTPNSTTLVIATGTEVMVGGEFSSIGGATRNRIASIDETTGRVTDWDPASNGSVYAIGVTTSTVYAGGSFTNIGGATRDYIAALDPVTASSTDWNPGADNGVEAIAVSTSTVYIGGWFNNIGGVSRSNLAALNMTTGEATNWNPNPDNNVYALALDGSTLYVGGSFRHISGVERGYAAALDTATASTTSWNASTNNNVDAIAVASSTVYLGGGFTSVRGTTRNYIAEVDKTTGVPTSWNPGANNGVNALQITSSTVYVGGYFGYIGGQTRYYLAELSREGESNQATAWNPSPDGYVYAFGLQGDELYVGGSFSNVEELHLNLAGFPIREVQFTSRVGAGLSTVPSVTIPISIPVAQAFDVAVRYSATGGTATGGGVDYTLADGIATIPAGHTTTSITLAITPNIVMSGDKTVVISLSDATNGYTVGANSEFTYTIQDHAFVVYESNDVAVTPGAPGTLSSNINAAVQDETYLTTAISTTTDGYDSQVYKFMPDLTGVTTSTFRTHWVGHGDGDPTKNVHLSIWNFLSSSWQELSAQVCNDDCDVSVDVTGNQYHDENGNVWIWLKADKQYGPATISDVTDNNSLLPIAWNTDVNADSQIAFDSVSHATGTWSDYASHLSDGGLSTYHALTPALYNNGSRSWQAVASSASGTVQIAGVYGGDLFISTDSGATWTDQGSAGSRSWVGVGISSDGTKMVAAVNGGQIYTSSNGGSTWATSTIAGTHNWETVSMSADGKALVAAAWNDDIYTATSSDGVNFTWTDQSDLGHAYWTSSAISSDGQHMAIGSIQSHLYTTADGGATWTDQTTPTNPYNGSNREWYGVAMSADGTSLLGVQDYGSVWTATSTDGVNFTWTSHRYDVGDRWWRGATMSADGQKMAVSDSNGGYIYVSLDGGATWTQQTTPGNGRSWQSLTMKADGTSMTAVAYNDDLYIGHAVDETANYSWADITGTTWYYRVRSTTGNGDTTTTDEFMVRVQTGSSCPFLYTYNGGHYNFILDLSSAGDLSSGADLQLWKATPFYKSLAGALPQPESWTKIPDGALAPHTVGDETYYDIKTDTQLNETNYYDKAALLLVDHAPGVEVFPDYRNNGQLHTIATDAAPPVTITDQNGADVTSLIAHRDTSYWHSQMNASPTYLTMKLSNATTTPAHLKLVIKRAKEGVVSGSTGRDQLQYKNASSTFVAVPSSYNPFTVTRAGAPDSSRNFANTYGTDVKVIDLSGLTIKDNTIRLVTTNNQTQWDIDWIAVDTSADAPVTVTTETPYYANLHFHGVSKLVPSNASDTQMILTQPDYDQLIQTTGKSNPLTGYATRYGDVLPLLTTVDDKFAIMTQGDELDLKYAVPTQADGTVRDYIYYTWDYHKSYHNALGDTIGPLPFSAMTKYPYHPEIESYPTDADHQAYLSTYNTREIQWGVNSERAPTKHHSLNTDFISMTAFAESGPSISNLAVSASTTSAIVTWTTDIDASTKVIYSPDESFASTTDETNTSPRVTSHSVELSDLVPCSYYSYEVLSADNIARTTTSTEDHFVTAGCAGGAAVVNQAVGNVTTTDSGSTQLADHGNTFTVNTPANFTATSSQITIQIKSLDSGLALGSIGKPDGSLLGAGPIVFDVKALIDSTTVLDSFDLPITISYHYSASDVSGINPASLWMYHYHNGAWDRLDACSVDTSAHVITCTTMSFSTFALFGTAAPVVRSSGGGGGGGGGIATYGCTDPRATNYNPHATNMSFPGQCQYTNPATALTPAPVVTPVVSAPSVSAGTSSAVTTPAALPANELDCSAVLNLKQSIRYGAKNNPANVKLLQKYLNTYEGTNLAIDGVYSKADRDAVIKWQEKYAAEILKPWGLKKGTGYVFTTSLKKMNQIHEMACVNTSAPATAPAATTPSSGFKRVLKSGSQGADVKQLQIFLNGHGFPLAVKGNGSAGHETTTYTSLLVKALAKFQEAHADQLLKPFKLNKGTGVFGETTRQFVNGMLGDGK